MEEEFQGFRVSKWCGKLLTTKVVEGNANHAKDSQRTEARITAIGDLHGAQINSPQRHRGTEKRGDF
jgi:hypothetical protein